MVIVHSIGRTNPRFDHTNAENYYSIFKHEHFCRHKLANVNELSDGVAGSRDSCKLSCGYSKVGNVSPVNYELSLATATRIAREETGPPLLANFGRRCGKNDV